jgi:hypothetical protein
MTVRARCPPGMQRLTPVQIDTPIIFAVLGGILVAFYLLKLYSVLEMKRVDAQRREALSILKKEGRPETPRSEQMSAPVTPETQSGRRNDDNWNITDS